MIVDGITTLVNPELLNILAPNPTRPFTNSTLVRKEQSRNASEYPLPSTPNYKKIKIIVIVTYRYLSFSENKIKMLLLL